MDVIGTFKTVGNYISGITKSGLDWLTKAGFFNSPITAKLLSIVILIGIGAVIFIMISALSKVAKIIIGIILALIILSIIISFFGV